MKAVSRLTKCEVFAFIVASFGVDLAELGAAALRATVIADLLFSPRTQQLGSLWAEPVVLLQPGEGVQNRSLGERGHGLNRVLDEVIRVVAMLERRLESVEAKVSEMPSLANKEAAAFVQNGNMPEWQKGVFNTMFKVLAPFGSVIAGAVESIGLPKVTFMAAGMPVLVAISTAVQRKFKT